MASASWIAATRANPKEIAYYKAPSVATTREGENDFTRPDPRYDAAKCMIYTGWNQGGLRIIELTNPEYNGCMRRAVNGGGRLGGSGKNKVNFGLQAARANGGRGELSGSFELNDRDADVKIHIDTLSCSARCVTRAERSCRPRTRCRSTAPGPTTRRPRASAFVCRIRVRAAGQGRPRLRYLHRGLHIYAGRRARGGNIEVVQRPYRRGEHLRQGAGHSRPLVSSIPR